MHLCLWNSKSFDFVFSVGLSAYDVLSTKSVKEKAIILVKTESVLNCIFSKINVKKLGQFL